MISSERFTHEVTALSPTLYRLCISILRSDADAQDAVQQGLMKAWAAKDTARPETFRPWLMASARVRWS
jgi:DNA-directed RNA polymerase specialized sigma24 family protein